MWNHNFTSVFINLLKSRKDSDLYSLFNKKNRSLHFKGVFSRKGKKRNNKNNRSSKHVSVPATQLEYTMHIIFNKASSEAASMWHVGLTRGESIDDGAPIVILYCNPLFAHGQNRRQVTWWKDSLSNRRLVL